MISKSQTYVSNPQIIRTLLAKDWRLYRAPIVGLFVIGVIYGLPALAIQPIPLSSISGQMYPKSIFACLLTVLFATVFGGTAIAGERRNRSAEFLATLPIKRIQIVASKFIISVIALATFGIFHAMMALKFETRRVDSVSQFISYSQNWAAIMSTLSGYAVCLFGVAWLFSTFSRSGPISAFASLAFTAGLHRWFSLIVAGDMAGREYAQYTETAYSWTIGLVSLVVGTIYYLRRIEP